MVVAPDVLAAEALYNEHHHILAAGHRAVLRHVHRGVYGVELGRGEIAGHGEHGLVERAYERERRVEHHGGLKRAVNILVGVAYGYGAHGRGGPSAHTNHRQRHIGQQPQQLNAVVGQRGLEPQRLAHTGRARAEGMK